MRIAASRGWVGLLLIVVAGVSGCTGVKVQEPEEKDPNTQAIISLVYSIADHATRRLTFPEFWVEGSMPDADTRKRMAQSAFTVVGDPEIQGSTATAKVQIQPAEGQPTETTWTFERVGEQWKIKSAPMS